MTNLGTGIFILIVVLFGLPVTILSILNRKESEVSFWFTLLCIANITWAVLHALEYFLLNEAAAAFVHNCKLAAVGAAAVFVYLVVLGTLKQKKTDGKLIVCMLSFPFCTFLASIADAIFDAGILYQKAFFQLQDGVRVVV